jgi:putative ABC transport system permease protein
MLRNFFKISFRNLKKNKVFSFINILGLSVGLATCLLIMLYIFDELSYDAFHKDVNRIYRVAFTSTSINKGESWSAEGGPFAAALKKDLPEVEDVTRLLKLPDLDQMLISYDSGGIKKQFFEEGGMYVDSSFLQIFTYPLKYGSQLNALKEPNSIVISEKMSSKLFGPENPVGKTIRVGMLFGEAPYTVKAVLENTGNKSHIPSGFFLSMKNTDVGGWVDAQNSWTTNNMFHTYVKLKQGTDPHIFENKLGAFFESKAGAEMKANGVSRVFFIQPLKSIYLHSDIGGEIAPNGNIKYVYILGSIAVFILLIACINFMNLSTARSQKRAKEVGVRKVLGAERFTLIKYYLGESLLFSAIAGAAAILMVKYFLPAFNVITHKNIGLFDQPTVVFWIGALTLATGLFSGLYPAVYLSSFKPVSVLKGKVMTAYSATLIRKGLVVFQFAISICLILGAIVIVQQLDYLKTRDLGFNSSQQIILPLKSVEGTNNYQVLKNELLKKPFIHSVTSSSAYPGMNKIMNDMLFFAEGKTNSDLVDFSMVVTDPDYFETLGIHILKGRPFSQDEKADSNSIILNESAVEMLGYTRENAIGKSIYYEIGQPGRRSLHIIGIVHNFNFESLHTQIKPIGFATNYFANKNSYVIANVKMSGYSGQVSEIEKSWKKINPNTPFIYSFLDQEFQKNYEHDALTSRIIIAFTGIAIFLACLGLFGLAAFSAEQRTREIGIRKVLGSSVSGVVSLLSKDFIKLVLLSILIGSPIAWFAMNKWLQAFAYKISISWWMFLEAGSVAVFIALVTVGFQALRAANRNPVTSLRSE